MTPVRGVVAAVVDGLVAVAARRWGVPAGDDRVREWHGELYALRHEPGVPPPVRAGRQIAFALSLAASRPAHPQGAAAMALDATWGLVGLLRPVLVLLAVPGIATALMQGYADAVRDSVFTLLLVPDRAIGTAGGFPGATVAFWIGLVLLTGCLLAAAQVFGRSWSASDPAHRRLVRLTAVPVLLAAGALLTPQPRVSAAALAAAAVVLAGAGLWAGRVGGARRWLVLVPAGAAAATVLFVAGHGPATMARGGVGIPAVTLAVAVFAVRCAADTTRRAPAWSAAGPAAGSAVRTAPAPAVDGSAGSPVAAPAARAVTLVTALVATVAGVAVLAMAEAGALPVGGRDTGLWTGWLTAIRQAATVLIVAGLAQVVAAHPRTRLAEDRRRRVSLAVAVVAACCVPSLLLHARWMWIVVEEAPAAFAPATAVLSGGLAALCLAGAVGARRAPLHTGAAVALVAGFALPVAAAASLSAGDGDDDPLVIIANIAGVLLTIPLLLTVRRVVLGRRPGRVRRTLLWTAAVVAMPLLGATLLLDALFRYADTVLQPDLGLHSAEPTALGTVLAALALAAFLGRRPARAGQPPP
ncbi:hypothetical protein AB0H83_18180 [Dactylosporangium sp. NPDC050688]|uniref:hypothetical protein n=1 Tax=Dactylosporangium sp. NPDC050688 TaxID=3157217 RepID=UPI0033E2558B